MPVDTTRLEYIVRYQGKTGTVPIRAAELQSMLPQISDGKVWSEFHDEAVTRSGLDGFRPPQDNRPPAPPETAPPSPPAEIPAAPSALSASAQPSQVSGAGTVSRATDEDE